MVVTGPVTLLEANDVLCQCCSCKLAFRLLFGQKAKESTWHNNVMQYAVLAVASGKNMF